MAVMSKESTAEAVASLRALTYRLTSCPPQQLPHVAPQMAASIWTCRRILSLPTDGGKVNADITQTASRFRASLSQLLQARSVEERWAAVVLAKAAVEAGGIEAVSKATGWAKSLTAILKKNDPPTTKILAIITLARIFTLTWRDTNLVREITTPALPGFVQACLATGEKKTASPSLLQTVLEAFATLLPRHPTVFRTYEGQIRALLLKLLSITSSAQTDAQVQTQSCQKAAGRLFVLLHHCAPKQGGPEKFDETLKATVTAAHTSCDLLFRSVNETWKSNAGIVKVAKAYTGELQLPGPDALGMIAWQGLNAGVERLVVLIRLLQSHFEVTTSSAAPLRVGMVADLVKRLLEANAGLRDQTTRFNAEVPKEERESLFRTMHDIHVAALSLLEILVVRLDQRMIPAVQDMIELPAAVFAAESADETLRQACYQLIGATLKLVGPTLSKDSVSDLSSVIRGCCDDLLPANSNVEARSMTPNTSDGKHCALLQARTSPGLYDAAWELLPLLFSKIDQCVLSAKLRTRMEQVAVLTRHRAALVACVLNPPKKSRDLALRPSLLPLLAKEFPECTGVEALLRPRYPIAGAKAIGQAEDGMRSDEEEDSSEDGEDEVEVAFHEEVDGQRVRPVADSAVDDRDGPPTPRVPAVDSSSPVEVFSTAPEHSNDTSASQPTSKRPALDSPPLLESDSKRLRASTPASAQPGGEAWPAEKATTSATVAGPTEARISATARTSANTKTVGEEEDDSDFEIPPLTMESDSESDDGGARD